MPEAISSDSQMTVAQPKSFAIASRLHQFLLLSILVVFTALTLSTDAVTVFGDSHDETLYMSSARSIAEGNGYTAPNLPGAPPQTKYPPLYSAVLSVLWRLAPDLNGAVTTAQMLNIVLGMVWLLGIFFWTQSRSGDNVALGVTAVVALHPLSAVLSSRILSDTGFAALLIWSCILASRSRPGRIASIAAVGALCALTTAMRSLGLFGALGIGVWALLRRRYWLAATAMIAGGLPILIRTHATPPIAVDALPGFAQNWIYYTDYVGFWLASVPDFATLQAQVIFNFTELLKSPAIQVLHLEAAGYASGTLQAIAIALSAGIVSGLARNVKERGLDPLMVAFPGYAAVLVLWNFSIMDRFLLPFLVLFVYGAWLELSSLSLAIRAVFQQRKPVLDRAIAGGFAVLLVCLVANAANSQLHTIPRTIAHQGSVRSDALVARDEAYEWIRSNTNRDDRFIAWEDAKLYLETNRAAIRAVSVRTSYFYNQDVSILNWDLDRLHETAEGIGASHWLVTPDDYSLSAGKEFMRDRQAVLLQSTPVLFESSDRSIRIYDATAISEESNHSDPADGQLSKITEKSQ